MTAPLLALTLLFVPGSDALTPVQLGDIAVSVPGSWKRSSADNSVKFTAPAGDAFFLVDVGHVATAGMAAELCRKKILAQMPPAEAWTLTTVGGKPAAQKRDVDSAKDGTPVETRTYVGCDGATTWSLVFHLDGRRKKTLGPLADRIAQSVSYGGKAVGR